LETGDGLSVRGEAYKEYQGHQCCKQDTLSLERVSTNAESPPCRHP
jgi:hypothetical protein